MNGSTQDKHGHHKDSSARNLRKTKVVEELEEKKSEESREEVGKDNSNKKKKKNVKIEMPTPEGPELV